MVYDQTCQSRLRRTHIEVGRYDMFRRYSKQRPSVIRAGYVETTLGMAGMTCSEDTAHKDLQSSQIRRGEKDLQTLVTAFHNLINPCQVEVKENLFCISSGARAQVANDILNAEAVGKAAFRTFTQKRLVVQTLKFNAPVPRESFSSLEKTRKLKSSKTVKISTQRNIFGQAHPYFFYTHFETRDICSEVHKEGLYLGVNVGIICVEVGHQVVLMS